MICKDVHLSTSRIFKKQLQRVIFIIIIIICYSIFFRTGILKCLITFCSWNRSNKLNTKYLTCDVFFSSLQQNWLFYFVCTIHFLITVKSLWNNLKRYINKGNYICGLLLNLLINNIVHPWKERNQRHFSMNSNVFY